MIVSNPPSRLVKHIIRSYARLAENTRVRPVLKENIPSILKDKIFYQNLDDSSKRWLQNLMKLLAGVTNINPTPGYPVNPQIPNYQFGDFNNNDPNGKNLYKNYMNMNNNMFIYKNGK